MTIQQARKRLQEIRPDLSDFFIAAIRSNRCGLGFSVFNERNASVDLVSGRYTLPLQESAERFGGDEC